MRRLLLVILFSPCLLCLGGGVHYWAYNALRDLGIGMGNSVWKPLGERLDHKALPDELYVGEHSAFYTTHQSSGEGTTLWRVSATGARRWSHFEGAVCSLANAGNVWFGLLSLPSPDRRDERIFKVVRSHDEGRTWEERGVVRNLSKLLVVSEQEVWGLGRELQVSTDAGQTFTRVPLPGERNSVTEQLSRGLDGTVWLVGPAELFRISEHGKHWTHEPIEGADLQAGSEGILAGRVGEALAIRRDAPGAEWIPFTRRDHWVKDFSVSGDTIRVVTGSVDPFKTGMDLWYHHSEDGGRTWEHVDTDLFKMAIDGRERGFGVELLGELYGHVP
ncbi:hypothetical protein [Archangium lansingense]|uniref:Exo-alpha-sialidase n=1 Tax=Archangium lansingense TaxID=2995310 RepID=A0ABT4AB89_9BACT|nr:hypothetical protein [Archangium lansinium]MCY1078943.1 hypothetical protein [Archangium lansinium]